MRRDPSVPTVEHIARLIQRADYLDEAAAGFGSLNGGARAERNALRWAVAELGAVYPHAIEPATQLADERLAHRRARKQEN